MFVMIVLILGCIAPVFAAQAEAPSRAALYSVPTVNWEPYWIVNRGEGRGILGDLMREVAALVPQALSPAEPLPVKRNQHLFDVGEIAVECCVNTAWRPQKDSNGVSLWSDTVMMTYETVITPRRADRSIDSVAALEGLDIATILGYGYAADDTFTRFDVANNIAQLTLVAAERVDAAIIDEYEYRYVVRQHPNVLPLANRLEKQARIGASELKIRIHSSRPDLLTPINEAIATLQERGVIEALVRAYSR